MNPTDAFLHARDLLFRYRDDYEAACAHFRWPRLTHFNWALDYFDVYARDNHRPALCLVGDEGLTTTLSFAELSERSSRMASFLRGLGVERRSRILVMLPNVAPLWELMLAAMKLGAVIIPATTLLTAADLEDRLKRGAVRVVVADASGVEKLADLPDAYIRLSVGVDAPGWRPLEDAYAASPDFIPDGPTPSDDPFLLYFTSGTTARPKLVMHTHASYSIGHLSTMYWIGLREGDRHLNISSPGWAKHAWSSFFAPWNAGATIMVLTHARFHAAQTLEAIVAAGVTTLCAPPTVWRMLILEDLSAYPVKLREVVGAGEPLNPEVIEKVRAAWGLTLRDGYGQTETTAQIGNSPGQPVRFGSMGRPLPGYQIVLLDHHGREADEGEIAIKLEPRPLALMTGYLDDLERTGQVMEGGYYRTGDEARRDPDGYYWYVGRGDDVFKSSDYRISPFELESALIEHPAVAEAAVIPSPDPIRLSVPKAFVVLTPGRTPDREQAREILAFIRAKLAPYKRIRRLEFAALPKTISGKIRRVQLRHEENARRAQDLRAELEFWEDDFADGK